MSGFLLDTCAISEAVKPKPNGGLAAWLLSVDPTKIYLSVLTLGEIRKGVELLADHGKKATIESWLTSSLPLQFSGRILPVDDQVADRWGRMIAGAKTAGITISPVDSLIAATALHHNLSIVTNNERHFSPLTTSITNPWL